MKQLILILLIIVTGLWFQACSQPDKPTIGLYIAIKRGDIDQIERHIYWKADINKINIDGHTPLHEAAYSGNVIVAQLLLKNGAEIDKANNINQTALDISLLKGHTQLADMLIKKFNAEFDSTQSLFDIVRNNVNDRDVFRYLSRNGAQVNNYDNDGNTPLIIALNNQQRLVAKHLINSNADVNLPSKDEQMPLSIALKLNNPDLISLLKSNGARESSN